MVGDKKDNEANRANLTENNPYKELPAILGNFTTRLPKIAREALAIHISFR